MDKEFFMLQIFADEGGDENAAAAEPTEEPGTEGEFEELIKGKYSSAFSKKTQGIIDKRFAKMKGYEKTAKAVEPLLKMISEENPGVDGDSPEELIKAFMDKRAPADEDEILRSAEIAARNQAEMRMREAIGAQIEDIKESYPSFSLKEELSSPEFIGLLRAGVPLKRAYETVNLDKIMGSAMRYAAKNAGVKTAEAIKSSGRVQESAVADTSTSVKRTDVNRLTEKDILKILDDVGRGAKITF